MSGKAYAMNSAAALWFFILSSTYHPPFESGRLGPMREEECRAVQVVLPGRCLQVIGMRTCEINGRPGSVTICPVLEGEVVR